MTSPEVDQDPRINDLINKVDAMSDEEFQALLDRNFIDLYNRQEDLDPEFGKLINKHFWELIII